MASSSTPKKTYIGLSVGNHNSVIAIINKEHRAEVIANEDGEHKTPTYIAFSGEEEYHGSQAKHQFVRNAQNTIQGFRDLLGKPYSEEVAKHTGSARIEANGEGKPEFVVTMENDEGESRELRLGAENAMQRYVGRLKTTAEEYLGRKIDGAVLAHPVGFGDSQKKAMQAACQAVGLELLQMIPEPVACALQYGLGNDASHDDAKDTVALVVDVGGTGADVSVVGVHGGLFTLVDSVHTDSVSGEIIDEVLVKHFAAEFKKQSGIDVLEQGDLRPIRKLRQAVEVTKRTLSSATAAPCAVESLAGGMDFNGSVNRTRFDIMAGKTYAPLVDAVAKVVAQAGYTPAQIDQVLLCGGAARIRKLQSKVIALFPEATVLRDDAGELDEIIASGCAEQAALIAQGIVDPSSGDAAGVQAKAVAKPLGLQMSADKLVPVLLKDTPLPASRTIKVSLPAGEKRAYIAISEGEPVPPPAEDNEGDENDEEAAEEEKERILYRPSKLLAEMVLEIDDADENTKVLVKFFVGTDSKLTVTATEPVSGKSITAEIPSQ
ncbi:Hsp70 protein that interacts with Zuo1p [Coemansia sp. RSA 1813]|nr:Hsp70 protein that interacts with Zuo1p [Coemansia sp. RSA 1646]KAJ1770396.1 Hsp70 protein that interacts with Zuo1p [Coemansia sp. RSA 1843]KAJ2088212.1 Hsp70 protein that interacts with Zuo1p [Coemansia sp. RSA 986]KAJ2215745.1 Hsp70 protein that interacts with Zuo1p [Coemansia sp. RSA 487]KAJ2566918.1 Hsp70 protein that interacts with Zuo1p [Coemansia sp. RSA 1813]